MDYKAEFPSDDDFDSSNGYSDNYQQQQQQSTNSNGTNQFNTSQGRLTNPSGLSKAELRKVSWKKIRNNKNEKIQF